MIAKKRPYIRLWHEMISNRPILISDHRVSDFIFDVVDNQTETRKFIAKMKHIMKITLKGFFLVTLLLVFFVKNPSFSQCPSSTNILFQDFNGAGTGASNTGTFNTGATGTAAGTETKGAYAASHSGNVTITDQADGCCAAGPDHWRENLTVSPGLLPTGNDGGTKLDYAMLVDGALTNGSFWCASVTVAPGEIYDFSAFYTSPWLEDKANDPGLYFTINGIQLGSTALVDQYNPTTGAPQPYTQQECYYTIPAGTSGSVLFCLNLMESTGCTGIPTTIVGNGCTYPAGAQQGQGNDILVDDISIKKCNSGGTTSGCTYAGTTLPVKLVSFNASKNSGNALLQWTTSSEENTSHFSIEKSYDAKNFHEIGTVSSHINSNIIEQYSFTDYDLEQTAYYRLKVIDLDNKYSNSGIVVLEQDARDVVKLIKNSSGELEISAVVLENTKMNLAVYSVMGQEIISEKLALTKGENIISKGLSSNGASSARIVRITTENGEVLLSEVVVW